MISKKTREQAALICAIAASNREGQHGEYAPDTSDVCKRLDINANLDRGPGSLAYDARAYVVSKIDPHGRFSLLWRTAQADAEAEALLRTGWSPK